MVTAPDAPLVVLESETGSGKTEAALWRFRHLFERGVVDGIYFALPTRVAASQIHARVMQFRDRVFGLEGGPAVVLAVPGQVRADHACGGALPEPPVPARQVLRRRTPTLPKDSLVILAMRFSRRLARASGAFRLRRGWAGRPAAI